MPHVRAVPVSPSDAAAARGRLRVNSAAVSADRGRPEVEPTFRLQLDMARVLTPVFTQLVDHGSLNHPNIAAIYLIEGPRPRHGVSRGRRSLCASREVRARWMRHCRSPRRLPRRAKQRTSRGHRLPLFPRGGGRGRGRQPAGVFVDHGLPLEGYRRDGTCGHVGKRARRQCLTIPPSG